MNRIQIVKALKTNHQEFIDFLKGLTGEEFEYAIKGKWSAGKQLKHIIMSVRPLNQAFMLPVFALKWQFGKSSRPSKTYEGLVKRYKERLAEVGSNAAPPRFQPSDVWVQEREQLTAKLSKHVDKLCRQIEKFSDAELNALILPHPLLGKVTLNEMLYFTVYHVSHHLEIIKKQLSHQ